MCQVTIAPAVVVLTMEVGVKNVSLSLHLGGWKNAVKVRNKILYLRDE